MIAAAALLASVARGVDFLGGLRCRSVHVLAVCCSRRSLGCSGMRSSSPSPETQDVRAAVEAARLRNQRAAA